MGCSCGKGNQLMISHLKNRKMSLLSGGRPKYWECLGKSIKKEHMISCGTQGKNLRASVCSTVVLQYTSPVVRGVFEARDEEVILRVKARVRHDAVGQPPARELRVEVLPGIVIGAVLGVGLVWEVQSPPVAQDDT